MSGSTIRKLIISIVLGILLAGGLFGAGVVVGQAVPLLPFNQPEALPQLPQLPQVTGEDSGPNPTPVAQPASTEDLFHPFWEAWQLVHDEYVDPVNDLELMRGAISGMLDALGDPHTGYMDPDEFEQANIPLEGTYEGIGAWVDSEADYLTIISPMPDSPAEESGLRSGDEIVAVDGDDMTGFEGSQVIRRVMGPAGTTVTLTIRRVDERELFDVDVTRREIVVPSVESEMLDDGIGYLRLYTFGEDTSRDTRQALQSLMAQNPDGLILDLRGNGGGFLNTAVDVSSEFLSGGLVLTERFGDGSEQPYQASRGGLATEIPLVVLIDGGSASASEIVAGAIQDRDRGLLVGATSFGKGSVQNWIPLSQDGGAVRVTIARWHTPDGRQIGDQGLTPDIVLEVEPEDITAEQDPQLDRAIEAVLELIGQ